MQAGASMPSGGDARRVVKSMRAWAARAWDSHRPVATLLRLLPRASRWGTAGLALEVLARGLLPLLVALAIGALIGALAGETTAALPGIDTPGEAVALVAAGFLLELVLLPFLKPLIESLAHRLDLLVRDRMLFALLAPATLAHLEDPELADEIALAHSVGTEHVRTSDALAALTSIASTRLLAASSAIVLIMYRWWTPLVLAAAWLVSNGSYRREMAALFSSLEGAAAGFRRAQYLSDLALGGAGAKEIRLFGLARWFAEQFEEHWRAGMRQAASERRGRRWAMMGSAVVLLGSHILVLILLSRSALRGDISLGDLAVYAQAALGLAGLAWDADREYILHLGAAPLPHALRVSAAAEESSFRLPGLRPPPEAPKQGIRFHGVHFTYPGTSHEVLADLDLWIPAGRSLAIVGDNGSGKTTLLKLLCRFYDPTRGFVTLDGVNLREVEPAPWQRGIAAMFQDFGRYPLSARDNVALGNLKHAYDEILERAAAAAGATDQIDGLPGGWQTPLSRQFAGGTDPSGGQWQRLALARVLLAIEGGARILILDEPTANLDVRAEADFYDRFLTLTRGLTSILVSHRFSTVRHADGIVVLDEGRIIESGSHADLIALGGRYAAMFNLQAARYRQSTDA